MFNRQPPVVVDKQPGRVALAQRNGRHDVGLYLMVLLIFDPQLEGAHPRLQQALNPHHAVDNRIEPEAKGHRWEIRLVHHTSSFLR